MEVPPLVEAVGERVPHVVVVELPRGVNRPSVRLGFRGAERDCGPCAYREQCLRTPAKTKTRQVAFFQGKAATTPESHTDQMKKRIDSPAGRMRYGRRC